jgi:hypothetical protein
MPAIDLFNIRIPLFLRPRKWSPAFSYPNEIDKGITHPSRSTGQSRSEA